MYRYETHLHTWPVSACASASPRETVEFYHSLGYDGIFITNHFKGGNITPGHDSSHGEFMEFYLADYYEARRIGQELGIKVLFGVEISYAGTDFLIYGLAPEWYCAHPEICGMRMSQCLRLMMDEGALVIQAHPFREARYIDHIRLFPRHVHGVEIYNASRTDFENCMAQQYAQNYGLAVFAGSDNHDAERHVNLGGIECEFSIESESELKELVLSGKIKIFREKNPKKQ